MLPERLHAADRKDGSEGLASGAAVRILHSGAPGLGPGSASDASFLLMCTLRSSR